MTAVHTCHSQPERCFLVMAKSFTGFAKPVLSQKHIRYFLVAPYMRRGEMIFHLGSGAEVWSPEFCMSGLAYKDPFLKKKKKRFKVSQSVLKFWVVLAATLQGLGYSFLHKAEQRWSLAHAQFYIYSLISYQSNDGNFSLLCNATAVVVCVCWSVSSALF